VVLEEAKALLETRLFIPLGRVPEANGCCVADFFTTDAVSFPFVDFEDTFSLVVAFVSFSAPVLAFNAAASLFLASRFLRMRSNSSLVYPPRVI
jgi:hypothetical protein